jgi:zinc metalloprotease ZmpB
MHTTTRALLALAATTSLTLAVAGAAPAAPGLSNGELQPAPSTGSASVFKVNPVQSSTAPDRGQSLTDQKDAASAVPQDAYADVELTRLDGSGYLVGDWVTVESSTGKPAYSSTGQFHFDRSQDQFEQVMAYYWITRAQDYLQRLGFGRSGTGLDGVMDERIAVKVGQYGGDNSYQTDKPFRLRFGKGGVDDAEDAEVIVHEYGHAIHADQVPGFGASPDAGAIGEGFGDYLAVTVGLDAAAENGWPVREETSGYVRSEADRGWEAEACVADWDATDYSQSVTAKCLRRLDQDFTVTTPNLEGVHARGMIWSGALWRIRQDYVSVGLQTTDWDTTMIDAQFGFAPGTTFQAAAQVLYDAAESDGPAAQAAVKQRFADRGIFVS